MIEDEKKTYNDVIKDIKQDINKTQFDIMLNANISLVNLYYRNIFKNKRLFKRKT